MSEQKRESDPAASASLLLGSGNQESRFLPGARIEARDITATNVANVQYIHLPGQKYAPPLQLPRRAEHFQDRVAERAWLLAHLHPGRIVTICGPGGMGKTALVAEVLWALAPGGTPPALFPDGIVFHSFYGQPETAVALEQLARTLGEDPLPTPAQAAQRALGGKRVLLVLDGVEEAENLEQVLSVCASCSVLATSRRRSDAPDPTLLLDLKRLPLEDAVTVVQAWQAQHETNAAAIERICQLVGGLPLALRLVGSYLALHPGEAEDYLAWLEEDVWEALDQGTTTRKSISMLLGRSVVRLPASTQSILCVIGLLALAPFKRDLVIDILEVTPRDSRRALDELVNCGLLVPLEKDYEVSHPLIHTYAHRLLLENNDLAQQRVFIAHLVTTLFKHFQEEAKLSNWAACERLVSHIQACASQLEQRGEALAQAASLFSQAGNYLRERGRFEPAEELCKQALATCEQVLEPEHVDFSESLDSLALVYLTQGRYEEAEPLLQRALAIDEQTLGHEHPSTAVILGNLAQLYQVQGRYEEAEPLLQRALAIKEKALGPEHPSTSIALNSLAELYRVQERYEEAEPLYQRALAIAEQMLGPEHPSTAVGLDNLANLYQVQGRYEEAEPLYQRALMIKEQALGPKHPHTGITLNNLARLYRMQGRYEEAEPLQLRDLAIVEQILGPEHPIAAITLSNLALLYQALGQNEAAEPLYQRALVIFEQAFPSDHPHTATVLESYATLLLAMNRLQEALTLNERAKAIRVRRSSQSNP